MGPMPGRGEVVSSFLKTLFCAVIATLAVGCGGGSGDRRSAPAASDDDTPAYGDAIVSGSIGDASVLIPMLAGDSSSHAISEMIFDGLIAYDKNLSQFEPRLAERWEVSDDGLELSFHLRHDVRWQDGTPFTARDVEFAFRTITDPSTLTAYAEDYRQVERFEVIDDYTIRVTYRQPFAPALGSWASSLIVLPKHLLDGKPINEQAREFGRHPVGLGPYRFESWESQKQISLRANHDYYRGRPYIERVVTRVIPDTQTQFLELKSGGLDEMGLTPLQFQRQTDTQEFRDSFAKYRYLTNSYSYLGYNLRRPLFQDVRVRRAITHAINKEEIVDAVLLGLGSPAAVPYKPGTFWFNDRVKGPEYDPGKAKRLLAEAGWADSDGDGVLDREGQRFQFEIITNKGNEQREKAATVIQRRLDEVGIKVTIKVIEWAAFINNFIDKRNFDAVILGWSLSPDPDQYDIWHSSKTRAKEFNFVTYSNAEVDELLEKGRRTFDREERKKYYDRLQEVIDDEQPYTFLYVADALPIVHRRFHGIEPAPAGISYNFNEWYVPASMQKYRIADAP
jgi:peptide/nickel transport system substrate-binding protein